MYFNIQNHEEITEEDSMERLDILIENFKIVMDEYPKSNAAARSAYYIANILFEKGDYNEAVKYYQKGYSINNDLYVSLLCLQKEASCYEQLNELEKAVQIYEKIKNEFNDNFIIPTVLFNLAQIYEKMNKFEKAEDEYSQIVTTYQWSSWKIFAEKRQLLIKNFQ